MRSSHSTRSRSDATAWKHRGRAPHGPVSGPIRCSVVESKHCALDAALLRHVATHMSHVPLAPPITQGPVEAAFAHIMMRRRIATMLYLALNLICSATYRDSCCRGSPSPDGSAHIMSMPAPSVGIVGCLGASLSDPPRQLTGDRNSQVGYNGTVRQSPSLSEEG